MATWKPLFVGDSQRRYINIKGSPVMCSSNLLLSKETWRMPGSAERDGEGEALGLCVGEVEALGLCVDEGEALGLCVGNGDGVTIDGIDDTYTGTVVVDVLSLMRRTRISCIVAPHACVTQLSEVGALEAHSTQLFRSHERPNIGDRHSVIQVCKSGET